MIEVGAIIGGRLRVDQVLGVGGMGIVVAATHLELGNKVAVKIMRDELAQNSTAVERFIREARAVVNLRTEHVCRVLDVGRLDNGAPYIVMEMLAGADLSRAISQRPLPVSTAVDYVMQTCVALAEAHAAGIVHRDLKPANLFVTRRLDGGPLVKVLDFGIAKAADAAGPHLTHTTGMMGSPGYMSPEQLVSARDVDVRTDIWALGVTLYQLVSGRMPFPAPTLTEIAIKVASDPPAPLDVDPALQAVIFRCLEKQPDRRYPTAAALSQDLARFASSDGRKTAATAAQVSGRPTPAPAPAPPPVARDAQTAASVMTGATQAPAPQAPPVHTPRPVQEPAPEPPRRARWPLVVGALALVGATVAVMLVVTGSKQAQTPTPGSGSVVAGGPLDAATAIAPADAAAIRVVGGDPDPWRASDGSIVPVQPEPEPDPDDEPDQEFEAHDATQFFGADHLQKLRTECREKLKDPKWEKNPIDAGRAVVCYCALGDIANAKRLINGMGLAMARNQLRAQCSAYGVKIPLEKP